MAKELLAAPLTLSLFRPATDNDNRDKNGARLWRNAGLDNLTQKVVSLKEGKTSTTARVEILNAKTQRVGTADFVYSLDKNGALKVHTTFQSDTTIVKSMARLGLTFRVANTYDQVSYLGRGDNETYIDRNQSGKIGVYQTTPERMFPLLCCSAIYRQPHRCTLGEVGKYFRRRPLCRIKSCFPV